MTKDEINPLLSQLKDGLICRGIKESQLQRIRFSSNNNIIATYYKQDIIVANKKKLPSLKTITDLVDFCFNELKKESSKRGIVTPEELLAKLNNGFSFEHQQFIKNNTPLKDCASEELKTILDCSKAIFDQTHVKFSASDEPTGGSITCVCGFKVDVRSYKTLHISDSILAHTKKAHEKRLRLRKKNYEENHQSSYLNSLQELEEFQKAYWHAEIFQQERKRLDDEKKHYLSAKDNQAPNLKLSRSLTENTALAKKSTVTRFIKTAIKTIDIALSEENLKNRHFKNLTELNTIKQFFEESPQSIALLQNNQWRCHQWILPTLTKDSLQQKIDDFFYKEDSEYRKLIKIPACDVITQALYELQDEHFGRLTFAKILYGSKSKDLIERRLNSNQWFGKLRMMSQPQIVDSIDELIRINVIHIKKYGYHDMPLVNIHKNKVICFDEPSSEPDQFAAVSATSITVKLSANEEAKQLLNKAQEGDWLAEFSIKAQAALKPMSQAAKVLKEITPKKLSK